MKISRQKIIEKFFPGTYAEYLESREIHIDEIKVYRKNPQYIVGALFSFIPMFYVVFFIEGWKWKLLVVLVLIGEVLMRDTNSEHYCSLLNRERKKPCQSGPMEE